MSMSFFWPQHVVNGDSGGLFCDSNTSTGCEEGRGVLLQNFARCSSKPAVSLTSSVQ